MNRIKIFITYLLKTYCWSVIGIVIATLFETSIIRQLGNESDYDSPFSSVPFAVLISGVIYPILNIPVFIALLKYKFSKVEAIVEGVCFLHIATYINDIIYLIFPQDQLWITDSEGRHAERVWWYGDFMNIAYAIIISILLCLIYFSIKKYLIKIVQN